jgi:hypothetical protein
MARRRRSRGRDYAAEALAVLDAWHVALDIACYAYHVDVRFADEHELLLHRYDDRLGSRLASIGAGTLLAVGCTAPHHQHHGPQVRVARRVLERLAAADVGAEDIERGEHLRGCLLNMAASLALRAGQRRAGRFAGGSRTGVVVVEELRDVEPLCPACLDDEGTWRAIIGRGQRRREVEQGLRDGRRVFLEYKRAMPRR